MTESFLKIFSTARSHLLLLEKQFQGEEHKTKCIENFSLSEFLSKLDNAVAEISHLSAQVEMIYKSLSPAKVQEMQELINTVEASADNLIHVFHSLPEEMGMRFHFDVLKMTKGVINALIHFIHSLITKESKNSKECVKYAENVLSKCEELQKMPKNNLESVLRFLQREELLLLDALQEIDEEVKSNFSGFKYGEEIDNTEMWNNQDKKLLPPCVALVKTSRFCLKKVISAIKSKGNCCTTANIVQLDDVAFAVEDLTQAVDNFVSAFYPPMNQSDVKRDALKVVNTIQNLLIIVQDCHFILREDQTWLNVLLKSVDHNNNKFQPLFSDEKFNETSETDNSDED